MKLYKAQIHYNNDDMNEWERVYTIESPWYSIKMCAEKHLEELQLFKKNIEQHYKDLDSSCFWCDNPEIIEIDVADEYVPLANSDFIEFTQNYKPKKALNVSDVKFKVLLSVPEQEDYCYPLFNIEIAAIFPNKTCEPILLISDAGRCTVQTESSDKLQEYTPKSINVLRELATDFIEDHLTYNRKNSDRKKVLEYETNVNGDVVCTLISLIKEDLLQLSEPEKFVIYLNDIIQYFERNNVWWNEYSNLLVLLKLLKEKIEKIY